MREVTPASPKRLTNAPPQTKTVHPTSPNWQNPDDSPFFIRYVDLDAVGTPEGRPYDLAPVRVKKKTSWGVRD